MFVTTLQKAQIMKVANAPVHQPKVDLSQDAWTPVWYRKFMRFGSGKEAEGMSITDEMLMAYTDGELPSDEARLVEQAITEDSGLAERAAVFANARKAVKDGLAVRLDDPVPPALVNQIRDMGAAHQAAQGPSGNVISLFGRQIVTSGSPAIWQLPIAASIALVVGATLGWFAGQGGENTPAGLQVTALGDPEITRALTAIPSGESLETASGNRISAIASFMNSDGQLCREFEYDQAAVTTVVAVACHENKGWDLRFAVAAAASSASGYAPASSLETLDAYLIASQAGAPLSIEAEAEALQAVR